MYVDQRNRLRFQLLLHEINDLLTMMAQGSMRHRFGLYRVRENVYAASGKADVRRRAACIAFTLMVAIKLAGQAFPAGIYVFAFQRILNGHEMSADQRKQGAKYG